MGGLVIRVPMKVSIATHVQNKVNNLYASAKTKCANEWTN